MARININDFDDKTLEKVKKMAEKRGCTSKKNPGIVDFVFNDYLNMCELNQFENPLLIKMMQQIFKSELELTEQHLGGRTLKLLSDLTINLSVLTQMFFDNLTRFDDKAEAMAIYDTYRKNAVEQLRETRSPITYSQLVKENDHE